MKRPVNATIVSSDHWQGNEIMLGLCSLNRSSCDRFTQMCNLTFKLMPTCILINGIKWGRLLHGQLSEEPSSLRGPFES